MTDVLHVLELDANLLSISALNWNGLSVFFEKDGVKIRQDNSIVVSGILRSKMYYLHTSRTALISIEDAGHVLTPVVLENSTPETRKLTLYQLWHACMGHVNPKQLGSFSEHVTGLNRITFLTLQNLNCNVCNFSNMTQIVNQDTPRRGERRLRRVHTDVWGPYQVSSIGGHTYFVSLLDNLTRKSWLIPMKFWKEIYQHISKQQTAIGLQTGEKVAIYRCDNAKEYQKFETLVRNNRTQMEYTTAYTPEKNGVAKRFNRTIIQMVRAMLVWSKLPQTFQDEAAYAANYLQNLLPAGQDSLSPSKLWDGNRPHVSHLQTFGCLVHFYIPSKNQAKLDRVLFQEIFFGYHSSQQACVYNPSTRKVQQHISVKFLEHVPGGTLLRVEDFESPTSLLLRYNNDDENDEIEENHLPSLHHTPETSNKAPPVETINQNLESLRGTVPLGDIDNPVGDSDNSTPNSENCPPPPPINTPQTLTSKQKKKKLTANKSTCRSAQTIKPFDKYHFNNKTGQQANDVRILD